MNSLNISLLSSESSEILGYIIDSLLKYKIPIHSVIMDSKKSHPRNISIWNERTRGQLPILPKSHFEKANIPFFFVKNHSSKITIDFVKKNKIDVLINAGTPRILNGDILSAPTFGVLNCHPGILPDFRGCTCVEWAIYLDEAVGNTIHIMSKDIDEGPIILQESISFKKTDKYHDIRVKVYNHGFDLLAKSVKKIVENPKVAYTQLDYVKKGRYFKVINDEKMVEVIEKISKGSYAFQF